MIIGEGSNCSPWGIEHDTIPPPTKENTHIAKEGTAHFSKTSFKITSIEIESNETLGKDLPIATVALGRSSEIGFYCSEFMPPDCTDTSTYNTLGTKGVPHLSEVPKHIGSTLGARHSTSPRLALFFWNHFSPFESHPIFLSLIVCMHLATRWCKA